MTTIIKRFVETDTGHRVPNHKSKCKHMHGHRYRWEAVIEGDIVQTSGVSDEGMLMDFSDISEILVNYIHDVVDHSFIVYEKDFLEEDVIIRWFEEPEIQKYLDLDISEDDRLDLRQIASPMYKWLKEAESESESD